MPTPNTEYRGVNSGNLLLRETALKSCEKEKQGSVTFCVHLETKGLWIGSFQWNEYKAFCFIYEGQNWVGDTDVNCTLINIKEIKKNKLSLPSSKKLSIQGDFGGAEVPPEVTHQSSNRLAKRRRLWTLEQGEKRSDSPQSRGRPTVTLWSA